MSDFQLNDTIVALASAAGKSGICMIRLSGPDAISIAAKFLTKPDKLFTALPNSGFHVEFVSGSGEPIDDGVVTVFHAPHSFTGEDVVEIAGHGSVAIVDTLISLFAQNGARLAEPGEFSRRAFYNGKLQLKDLELITSRVEALDVTTLRGSAKSIEEKFLRLEELYRLLIGLLAEVNADIDFGDSDALPASKINERLDAAIVVVGDLLAASRIKAANAGPFTVAFTGPPNVGKSSLFNALIAFKRSIVSETPGTTRDYLEAFIDLDGHRIKLVDTAGEREAIGDIEREGIELGRSAALDADLTFRVTDPNDRDPQTDWDIILLHNKSDLDGLEHPLAVSTFTGQGLDRLRAHILSEAVAISNELTKPAFSITERLLLHAVKDLLVGLSDSRLSDPGLLADDLRAIIDTIAPILGLNISEDALNHIFASMCIGK